MIDNEIRKQYRQVINDLKVAVIKTWVYRICEQAVERLRKILNQNLRKTRKHGMVRTL